MAKDKKKIKIPKSVKQLRWSPEKYAKKNGIKLKGKGLSKGEKKRNRKKLKAEYAISAINGLNKAVRILAENSSSDSKKIEKVKDGIENIIINDPIIRKIGKIYKKNPDDYNNMIFLPNMIINTILYYNQDSISDEEKEISNKLNSDNLITFCEAILKKKIKQYKKSGLNKETSFQMAATLPTTKILKNNRAWYKKLIQSMYMMAEKNDIDINEIFKSIIKLDKKKYINKNNFYEDFFSEYIMLKFSNKNYSHSDSQKELHERLIEKTLEYLDSLKSSKIRDILKRYIKRRKTAEEYKNDSKRIIKFIDHAHSNSPYNNLKSAIQDLISDNSSYELYLS